MTNSCGNCTLCCKLLGVKELEKPYNKWCEFCTPGRGCNIYEQRPFSCKDFECGYLLSNLPIEFRPDNLHIIITGEAEKIGAIILHVDPNFPHSTESKNGKRLLELFSRNNKPVIIVTGDKRRILTTSVKDAEKARKIIWEAENGKGSEEETN